MRYQPGAIKTFALASIGWAFAICAARADDWPQWLGPQRDGVWRETGILEKFPTSGPRYRWRTPIGGGYSGPAIADGKVYITDRMLAKDAKPPANPFDAKTVAAGVERILCLEADSGKILWTHQYECPYKVSYAAGPRTTPIIQDGKVFSLGTMGDLICLQAETGSPIWAKNLPRDYQTKVPFWGFSAHPLLDGNKLICLVGGKGSVVVAFDKDTGKELWRALSAKEIGYAPPMIFESGGKRQLIVWHPESVNSLDPESGKVYWTQPFVSGAAMSIPTPRKAGDLLFVTCFYSGSLMIKLDPEKPDAQVLWKGKGKGEQPKQTDKLHCVMSTPFIKDGYIYGVCSYGQLRCLKADTGERVWETLKPTTGGKLQRWANAFLIEQGDRVFLFNEKGDLIIARLTPQGYDEISRAHVLEPTNTMVTGSRDGGNVVWSYPAFARKAMFARNDKEIVCVGLGTEENGEK